MLILPFAFDFLSLCTCPNHMCVCVSLWTIINLTYHSRTSLWNMTVRLMYVCAFVVIVFPFFFAFLQGFIHTFLSICTKKNAKKEIRIMKLYWSWNITCFLFIFLFRFEENGSAWKLWIFSRFLFIFVGKESTFFFFLAVSYWYYSKYFHPILTKWCDDRIKRYNKQLSYTNGILKRMKKKWKAKGRRQRRKEKLWKLLLNAATV